MALLSLMKDWTSTSRLVAITVDHGFRSGNISSILLIA